MVKSLIDRCLEHIANNLHTFGKYDLGQWLTLEQKEILLKRMTVHQQLVPDNMRFIEKYLFTSQLKKLELHHGTSVVHNSFLISLSKLGCSFEYISIVNCRFITDDGLFPLLRKQPRLHFLKLKKLPLVTGQCLSMLQSMKLQKLVLKNIAQLKDQYVVQVLSNCPMVSSLDLQYCRELSDASVVAAAAILKNNVRILRISGLFKATGQCIESIIRNCTNLKELKLHGCTKLSQECISKVLCEMNLSSIDISYTCHNNSPHVQFSGDFSTSLEELRCCGVQIHEDRLLDIVNRCNNLIHLELCGIETVNDTQIKKMTSVLGDRCKALDLSYCKNITDKGLETIIRNCIKLESLSLYNHGGSGEPLRELSYPQFKEQAKCLRCLIIPTCQKFNSDVLYAVLPCVPNLTDLNIAGMCGIEDDFLYSLAQNCQKLKNVNFKCVKGVNGITDVGICALVERTQLVDIALSGLHALTDKSIFMMASNIASTLEYLYISACALITPPAVQYLKDVSVKGVYVAHRIPNAPDTLLMAKNLDTGEFCRADLMA